MGGAAVNKDLTAEEMLTWLNGRAMKIKIVHNGRIVEIWEPCDGTSIEDMIISFVTDRNIDVRDEIENGEAAEKADPDKPHRCPKCWTIPEEAQQSGRALPNTTYNCANCGARWRTE